MKQEPKTILGVELYIRFSQNRPFFFSQLEKLKWVYTVYCLGTETTYAIFVKSVLIPMRVSKFDFIITSEYFSAFAVNLRLLLTRAKTKHVTIGLNQSRRLLRTGVQWADAIINSIFQRTDLVIVHSRREAELFAHIHHIHNDRFCFSPWGFDLPEITPTQFSRWGKRYVCLVGRNNRDIETFVAAICGMEVDGIVITSEQHIPTGKLPPNVHVFCDLALNETLDCIRNATANTILLKDNQTPGAGHITAVAAMFARIYRLRCGRDQRLSRRRLQCDYGSIGEPTGGSAGD